MDIATFDNADKRTLRNIISVKIKELRQQNNLTQEAMSRALGMTSYLTYKGYENRKSDIPLIHLVRIAKMFNVSLDYITGQTDTPEKVDNKAISDILKRLEELENKT